MIVPNFATMRAVFAAPGAPVAADGYVTFPGTTKLRTGGFTGLVTPTITSYPISITCNAGAADGTLGVHEYDWWLSQRTEVVANQCLTMVHADPTKSGTVQIALVGGNVAKLLPGLSGPDLLTAEALSTIFCNVHLYVSRRSDRSYQWIRLVNP